MFKIFLCFFWFAALAYAELKFEAKVVEVDSATDEKSVIADFKFTNTGKKDVVIKDVKTLCTQCLDAMVSGGERVKQGEGYWFRFKPGVSGTIRGKFGVENQKGSIERKLGVVIDEDSADKPSLILECNIKVPQLITISQSPLVWKIGEADEKIVILQVKEGESITVSAPKLTSENFKTSFKSLDDGRYEFRVKPLKTESRQIALCTFHTSSGNPRYQRKRLYLKVEE